jgi:FtsZ-binding cell division protein ZapB
MDREREAWQNIKDNATSDYHYAEVYDATPTLVCGVFSGFLLYLYNESNIEETLSKAVDQAIVSLEQTIQLQSKEISELKEENKKIHRYLQLWTPLDTQRLRQRYEDRRKPPSADDLFDLGPEIIINGRALPPLRKLNQEEQLCLPF